MENRITVTFEELQDFYRPKEVVKLTFTLYGAAGLRDSIGLFTRDWSQVSQSILKVGIPRSDMSSKRTLRFELPVLPTEKGLSFVFCYINSFEEVLGVSSEFKIGARFDYELVEARRHLAEYTRTKEVLDSQFQEYEEEEGSLTLKIIRNKKKINDIFKVKMEALKKDNETLADNLAKSVEVKEWIQKPYEALKKENAELNADLESLKKRIESEEDKRTLQGRLKRSDIDDISRSTLSAVVVNLYFLGMLTGVHGK